MVNSGKNRVCTMRTQPVHNVYVRFDVNEQKQKVNGSNDLTLCINQLFTSEVLI